MAIEYNIQTVSPSRVTLTMFGDGVSTSIVINLRKSPVNLNLADRPPASIHATVQVFAGINATYSYNPATLEITATFASAPPVVTDTATGVGTMDINLTYGA